MGSRLMSLSGGGEWDGGGLSEWRRFMIHCLSSLLPLILSKNRARSAAVKRKTQLRDWFSVGPFICVWSARGFAGAPYAGICAASKDEFVQLLITHFWQSLNY